MGQIDPVRHPVLHLVSHGAQWIGQDDYPAWAEWADEDEQRLEFIRNAGRLDHYLPRLRGPAKRRDEARAEVTAAYFLEKLCGLPIIEWEPRGRGTTRGDFLVDLGPAGQMFVEVKSPGWEAEIAKAEGQDTARLRRPKYVHAEALTTAPWASVRTAVAKAYRKMPASISTLLIIHDDLMVPLSEWLKPVQIALYCERADGHTDGYLAEDGCFVGHRYECLGAVGILNVELKGAISEYRFTLFRNPNALRAVTLPRAVFAGYPSYDAPDW
jgi:hypothetical protein